MAQPLMILGEVDDAVRMSEDAIRRAESLGDFGSLAFATGQSLPVLAICGRVEDVLKRAEAFAAHASEKGAGLWESVAKFWASWARGLVTRDPASAATELRDIIAAKRERRERQGMYIWQGLLAQLQGKAGAIDDAFASIAEGLALAEQTGGHRADSLLHRVRGDIFAERDPAAAEAAYREALRIAQAQGARTFELQAAHALARLLQRAAHLADAHAVLAPALEGFSPTPEMPEVAEAQALLASLAEMDEVKTAVARRQRLGQLHVAYGNALLQARGYGAPETNEAFARARESALGEKDATERLAADFGLWVGSSNRGELSAARAHAEAFLNDVDSRPGSPEATVAHRMVGVTHWFSGQYREAREHLERALALFQPGRDDDLAFRFGHDPGIGAMLYLAVALWPLGDVGRAVSLVGDAEARIAGLRHIGTRAYEKWHAALFELMRGDLARTEREAVELARLAREHDLPMWRAYAVFLEGVARAESGALGGLEDMRRGAELLREHNVLPYDDLIKIALAEAEARTGDVDRAFAVLDEALATCGRTGYRSFEAELHRVRGEMLLKRDPANPALAEEALQTAVAVARQQGTRSFELRAVLALANLYQSIGHPAEAHAVLAPALEGFSPTPEMPEIAKAQGLLAALAETDEVKAAVVLRERRLHLQTAYGQAVMWSKGFGAEETKEAFARARELAAATDDFSGRFATCHLQWSLALVRGELKSARELASTYLREAEGAGCMMEAGVARRALAFMCLFSGDFIEARTHCERALDTYDPVRDREARERFSDDTGIVATSCLAVTNWYLGEVVRARELIDSASRRATELGHAASMAQPLSMRSHLEHLRGDEAAALTAAEGLEVLSREHGLAFWRVMAKLHLACARGRLHDPAAGAVELRLALADFADQGARYGVTYFEGLLAELEAKTLGADSALARIDEALALHGDNRCDLAYLHRLRGDILLKRDPADPAPAEDAYRTAVAIAKQQGARSYELLASLSLAKLYQSTGRPADAHAVLAPALEGFAPTPEMPEIAEAQALLAALAEADEVRVEAARRRRMTQIRVAYGNALLHGQGMSSPETTAAFAKASALAGTVADSAERLSIYYGLWVGPFIRGDLASMREAAETFLADAERRSDLGEAGIAHRLMGTTCWYAGDYLSARPHLDKALAAYDHNRDRGISASFGYDEGVPAKFRLGMTLWALGDIDRGARLVDDSLSLALQGEHVPTIALASYYMIVFAVIRREPDVATPHAQALLDLDRRHGLPDWRGFAKFHLAWAARRSDRKPSSRCAPPWLSSARGISSSSCRSLAHGWPKRRPRRAK